MVLIEVFING